jgi:hypothetical protein
MPMLTPPTLSPVACKFMYVSIRNKQKSVIGARIVGHTDSHVKILRILPPPSLLHAVMVGLRLFMRGSGKGGLERRGNNLVGDCEHFSCIFVALGSKSRHRCMGESRMGEYYLMDDMQTRTWVSIVESFSFYHVWEIDAFQSAREIGSNLFCRRSV